jgi:hypothetical protein
MPQTDSTPIVEALQRGSGRLHPHLATSTHERLDFDAQRYSPKRQQLRQLTEHTLTSIRREVMKTPQGHSLQVEDYSRPWAIIRLLPNARRYTIARFFNRQDAEDYRRFLNRFMPAAEFEIIFDVPNEQLQQATYQQED